MKRDLSEVPSKLHKLGCKAAGIAHMIEQLGKSDSPPERPDEVFYGISLLLDEQSKEIKSIANFIEGTED